MRKWLLRKLLEGYKEKLLSVPYTPKSSSIVHYIDYLLEEGL